MHIKKQTFVFQALQKLMGRQNINRLRKGELFSQSKGEIRRGEKIQSFKASQGQFNILSSRGRSPRNGMIKEWLRGAWSIKKNYEFKSRRYEYLEYRLKLAQGALIVLLVILVGIWGVQAAYGAVTKLEGSQQDAVVDADVAAAAAIAGTKISPDFGSQKIITTGSVGIGTTVPQVELDVVGDIQARGTGNVYGTKFWDTNDNSYYLDPSATGTALNTAGIITVSGSGNNYFAGNVGISVTNPGSKLVVDGDINISDTATNRLVLPLSNDAVTPTISFGDGNTGFYEISDNTLGLSTGGTLRWSWTNSRYYGATTGSGMLRNLATSGTVPTHAFVGDEDTGIGSSDADSLSLIAGATEMLRLDQDNSKSYFPSGNVGIGTTGPSDSLHVYADSATEKTLARFQNVNSTGYSKIEIDRPSTYRYAATVYTTAGSDNWYTGTLYGAGSINNAYSIGTNNSLSNAALTILTSGNVGIGTTSPDVALHIAGGGDINLTGATLVSDNAGGLTINTSAGKDIVIDSGSSGDAQRILIGTSDYMEFQSSSVVRGGITPTNDVLSLYGGTTQADHLSIDSSGNVGIGTISPQAKLDVRGELSMDSNKIINLGTPEFDADATTKSYVDSVVGGGEPGVGIWQSSGTDAYLNTSYNQVGIGTTSPEAELHVESATPILIIEDTDTTVVAEQILGRIDFRQNDDSGSGTGIGGSIYSISQSATGQGSALVFETGVPDAGSEKVRIDQNGNVGIGVTSPDNTLHVTGGIRADGVGDESSGTASVNLAVLSSVPTIYTLATSDLAFKTGGGERMRILSGGNVGIGTTTPAYLLNVYKPGATNYTSTDRQSTTYESGYIWGSPSAIEWKAYMPTTSGDLRFNDGTGDKITFEAGGNVGIGTTGPTDHLDIYGSGTQVLRVQSTSGDPVLRLVDGSSNEWTLRSDYSDSSNFEIRGPNGLSDRFVTISTNGNVGIGTISPQTKLHVWGGGVDIRDANLNFSGTSGRNITNVNKLTVTTIDPVYEIDGQKYATYGHSTVGLKEEVVGKVQLSMINNKLSNNQLSIINDSIYSYTIDFGTAKDGSDLWLFKEITAFGDGWEDLIVILTPEGRADVWYELMPNENSLVIFANKPVVVSYRLISSRHDWPDINTNLMTDDGIIGTKIR